MDFHWHAYSVKEIMSVVHRNMKEFLIGLKVGALRQDGPKSVKYNPPVTALEYI